MIETFAAVTISLKMGNATAGAFDLKELMPCRSAAAGLCDRSQLITVTALWRWGTTLPTHRHEVGRGCRAVLRRHGHDVMPTATADT
jgi:hypothetical protein